MITVVLSAETPEKGVTELDANKNYSHLEKFLEWFMRLNKNTLTHITHSGASTLASLYDILLLYCALYYDPRCVYDLT